MISFLLALILWAGPICATEPTLVVMEHVEDLWGAEHGTIGGYYNATTETIYVETRGRSYYDQFTYLHEYGHHLDYQCSDGSHGEVWADAYAWQMMFGFQPDREGRQ